MLTGKRVLRSQSETRLLSTSLDRARPGRQDEMRTSSALSSIASSGSGRRLVCGGGDHFARRLHHWDFCTCNGFPVTYPPHGRDEVFLLPSARSSARRRGPVNIGLAQLAFDSTITPAGREIRGPDDLQHVVDRDAFG